MPDNPAYTSKDGVTQARSIIPQGLLVFVAPHPARPPSPGPGQSCEDAIPDFGRAALARYNGANTIEVVHTLTLSIVLPAMPTRHTSRITVLVVVTLLLTGCSLFAPVARSAGVPGPAAYPREARDLPAIHYNDLPREAKQTLQLIDEGGPFPYDQDGQTFENREGILPDRPAGYYTEYTVETPGSDDRGARRIVAGDERERYYTDDHYESFSKVIR